MTKLTIDTEISLEKIDSGIDHENLIMTRELEIHLRQVSARNGFGAPEAAMEIRSLSHSADRMERARLRE